MGISRIPRLIYSASLFTNKLVELKSFELIRTLQLCCSKNWYREKIDYLALYRLL